MPRAEYDVVAEIYHGSNTGMPGVFKRFQTGRLVQLPRVKIVEPPFSVRVGYFTYNGPLILAGFDPYIPFTVSMDLAAADVVRIVGSGFGDLSVMFNELIIPRFGVTPYRRAHLIPL